MRAQLGIARGPLLATMLIAALSSCSDDETKADPPIPPRADSGFLLQANAFSFENFATGYDDARLTPMLVERMFGPSVCAGMASPCVLTPTARVWANRTNASMDGGRCEGLAVLSSLFYGAALDPTAFGGASARALSLDSNPLLQREIAYWFATQDVPSVAKTMKLGAKDALRLLSTALQPNADEFYRIGIVRKTARGISGGHALTPIRYEPTAEEGVFTLHVYDNNYPDEDRTMKIDIVRDRWEYQASATPSEAAALYYGDASNKNAMYFGRVKTRIGTLPSPFAEGVPESMTFFHGVNASAADKSGNAAGIGPDGEIVETGAGQLSPSVSAVVPTWTGASPVKVFLPTGDTTVTVSGADNTLPGAATGTITQYGSGYTVDVSQLALGAGLADMLSVSNGGRLTSYVGPSHTPITIDASVQSNGQVLEVRLEVPSGGTSVTTQLDPATGQVKVTADGTQGSKVTLTVTKVDVTSGTTITGTLTADGAATNTITVDTTKLVMNGALLGQQDTGMGGTSVGATCTDGAKNGNESDIDCGGTCPTLCADGKGCAATSDCASSVCNLTTGLCVATPCLDGAKNGTETDVDCGGMCSLKCARGKACLSGNDCTANLLCEADVCTSLDRIVFVSSMTFNGNLGGLAGADAKCQAAAVSGALPGTYKAYLSAAPVSAAGRLTQGLGAYVLVDGVTVVAADATAFFSPTHALPINKDEKNVAVNAGEVWTASFGNGFGDGEGSCASWTNSANDAVAEAGRSDFADTRWQAFQLSTCNVARHLYCVQQ